jgi:hypothetical protein
VLDGCYRCWTSFVKESIAVAGRASTDRIAMSAGADDVPKPPDDEPPSQSPKAGGAAG